MDDLTSIHPVEGKSKSSKSTGRVVAKATGLMIVTIFLSRILGFVRESLLIYFFGRGALTDIYKQSFIIPDVLYFLIAGGALSSAFIPVFTKYLAEGNEEDAWKTFSIIACIALIAAAFFIGIAEIYSVPFSRVLSPGFRPEQVQQMAYLTRIILPAQVFFFLGGLMMGTLYSRNHFLAPAFGPLIYNIGIIGGGLISAKMHAADLRYLSRPEIVNAMHIYFSSHSTPAQIAAVTHAYDIHHLLVIGTRAVSGYSWGALVGAFIGNFVFQIIAMRKIGVRFKFSLDITHPGVKQVFILMLPVILGLSLPQVDVQVNKYFGTLLGEGAVTALDNANRLMQVPYGVFGQAFATALFPTLSALAAKKLWSDYRSQLSQGIRGIVFMTLPTSVLMMVLSVPIIRLVFEHGRLVTAQDTWITAFTLILYCIGVFAWSMQAVIARGYYAMHDSVTVVVTGTIMTVVFVLMNTAYIHTAWAHTALAPGGLALTTTIAAILHTFVLMWLLRNRIGGIDGRHILTSTSKMFLASCVMALAAGAVYWGLANWRDIIMMPKMISTMIELVFAGTIGIAAYGLTAKALKMEEMDYALSMFGRRFRRSKSN